MTAYYNEIDPFAVEWTRELIREGVIADGIVDDRSIELVEPRDLDGFTQCHFFAGIGVWSYALRLAGWPDDRPVWTGSCPCQPFSAAGKEEGFADPRHLWPRWFRLARVHRPVTIFGEQVDRAIRSRWLDLVSTDLEAEGYAVGSVVYGSHSVGAPHRRQQLYFVADRDGSGYPIIQRAVASDVPRREEGWRSQSGLERSVTTGDLADSDDNGRGRRRLSQPEGQVRPLESSGPRVAGGLVDPESGRRGIVGDASRPRSSGHVDGERARLERLGRYVDHWHEPRRLRTFAIGSTTPPSVLSGFWSDAEWIECTDGKARPVEPGSFPLAHGSPSRVGRLRGYGNAINAEAAKAFVEAYLSLGR